MNHNRNIVLFHPHVRVGRQAQSRTSIPLGLLSIATKLDLAGYSIKIIDQSIESNWKNMLSLELKKNPLCVGVSTKTGPQIKFALEASKTVKQFGDTPVVWGGVHPSLLPEQTLENKNNHIYVISIRQRRREIFKNSIYFFKRNWAAM